MAGVRGEAVVGAFGAAAGVTRGTAVRAFGAAAGAAMMEAAMEARFGAAAGFGATSTVTGSAAPRLGFSSW